VFLHPVGSAGTYSILVRPGRETSTHYFSSSHGPNVISTKKRDSLFFMLGWDWYGFDKKHIEICYAKLVFLDSVGSEGHVVHSRASGVQNVDALFFYSGGPGVVSIKSVMGHVKQNICFCIQWHLRVT
jgi:hypothetical protein